MKNLVKLITGDGLECLQEVPGGVPLPTQIVRTVYKDTIPVAIRIYRLTENREYVEIVE